MTLVEQDVQANSSGTLNLYGEFFLFLALHTFKIYLGSIQSSRFAAYLVHSYDKTYGVYKAHCKYSSQLVITRTLGGSSHQGFRAKASIPRKLPNEQVRP